MVSYRCGVNHGDVSWVFLSCHLRNLEHLMLGDADQLGNCQLNQTWCMMDCCVRSTLSKTAYVM